LSFLRFLPEGYGLHDALLRAAGNIINKHKVSLGTTATENMYGEQTELRE
jgi:hypothetical protein